MRALSFVAHLLTPAFLVGIPLYAAFHGVDVYGVFVRGASEGLRSIVRIAPAMICMFTAVGLLSDSGALNATERALAPAARALGISSDVILLAFIRPLSGSSALGLLAKILHDKGPDSFDGLLASTIQGSADTALYVVAVYFGSVNVSRTRHTVAVAVLSAMAGVAASVVACRISFAALL